MLAKFWLLFHEGVDYIGCFASGWVNWETHDFLWSCKSRMCNDYGTLHTSGIGPSHMKNIFTFRISFMPQMFAIFIGKCVRTWGARCWKNSIVVHATMTVKRKTGGRCNFRSQASILLVTALFKFSLLAREPNSTPRRRVLTPRLHCFEAQ